MTAPETPEISPLPVFGPYEVEREALAAPLPHRCETARGDNLAHTRRMLKRVHLDQVLHDLGVPMGAYDMRVTSWLLESAEPHVVQVLIGLLTRAHAAGRGELPREPVTPPCPTGDPWCRRGSHCDSCAAAPGYGRPALVLSPEDLAQHEAGS